MLSVFLFQCICLAFICPYFGKLVFKLLVHSFIGLFVLLLLVFPHSLYILVTCFLFGKWLAKVKSQYMLSYFHFVSFGD